MHLTEVRPDEGARRGKKRVGRGRASGHGKTSTRGHNGQGQRSGESKRFGFEGGQTPLFRLRLHRSGLDRRQDRGRSKRVGDHHFQSCSSA